LRPGSRVGHFEIVGDLGAGAMGEVYRARDQELGRDVALKVLPASVAGDPERLARLRREAQMIAALNHPNIAQIHAVQDNALVLELVDGETLADRIAHGPLRKNDALAIAGQMAAALEAAHNAGVVHRDFKPANVKIKDDGTVKVLDFGLAKPTGAPQPPSQRAGSPGSDAPTLLVEAGLASRTDRIDPDSARGAPGAAPQQHSPIESEHGMIVGTACYMSPEQAQGRSVDKRADIWAFGVVLVEMLTGRRPFEGATVGDTLAEVISRAPDLRGVPPAFRRLIERCLEKDPRRRLRDIGDAMSLVDTDTAIVHERSGPGRWLWLATAAVMVLVIAAATGVWLLRRGAAAPSAPAARFLIDAPSSAAFNYTYTGTAVSPDGKTIVFRVTSDGHAPSLWLRPLDSITARPLAGTDNGDFPFWSPDGRSLAFFVGGKLKRLDVQDARADTAPVVLCDAPDEDTAVTGGAWNRDGVILIGSPAGLSRASASGGSPAQLVAPVDTAGRETGYGSPQFLPDGNRFIFFVRHAEFAKQGYYESALSDPGRKRLIFATDRKAAFVANDGGDSPYLLYLQEQTLLARKIDAATLAFTGEPAPIADGIAVFPPGFQASYWVSQTGVLAYRTIASDRPRLTWVAADGTRKPETIGDDFITFVRLSPDASKALLEVTDGTGNRDIWISDFARNARTRVTFDTRPDRSPVWSPNGREVVYSSLESGVFQLLRKDPTSSQPAVQLTTGATHKTAMEWSRDGRYLLFIDRAPATNEDVWALPMDGKRPPFAVVSGPGVETNPALSPDGKWLAFESAGSGRPEIYVQRFVESATIANQAGAQWQISTEGGSRARWSSDGRHLFFVGLNENSLYSATIRATASGIENDPPRLFTEIPLVLDTRSPYDVAGTGSKVLILERTINQGAPLIVLTNWIGAIR
jgi:Tol biopolymer transport system component